ncbi:MAG: ADP-ribosylglycohydrolase family protein, partial [Lachnospiraceae bacterium]|nr:ADP-ribosylglycohydrolase family protein [Lachnospiraceae bacterium]
MYGAIFGDIIGSPFEFDMGDKTKQFELFSEKSYFTDDTVMTIAIGEALMEAGRDASEEDIEKKVTAAMQRWGHK